MYICKWRTVIIRDNMAVEESGGPMADNWSQTPGPPQLQANVK